MYNVPSPVEDPRDDKRRLKQSFIIVAGFTLLLWIIRIIESVTGISLVEFGIYPDHLQGLAGIVLAPLIHSSFSHLIANTLPLLILGTVVLYGYPRSARILIPVVWLGTGTGVWLFARPAWHIGASGLTFGFMFFVFTIGALRWDRKAIALSMTVFLLYGGTIMGIFPEKPEISYESHFFGALTGFIMAILLRNTDPPPPGKIYSWEQEDDEVSDEYNHFDYRE